MKIPKHFFAAIQPQSTVVPPSTPPAPIEEPAREPPSVESAPHAEAQAQATPIDEPHRDQPQHAQVESVAAPTKRKPGRPRKNPPPDPNAPKRKPGRPRKVPEGFRSCAKHLDGRGAVLPLSSFSGGSAYCRDCTSVYRRDLYRKNNNAYQALARDSRQYQAAQTAIAVSEAAEKVKSLKLNIIRCSCCGLGDDVLVEIRLNVALCRVCAVPVNSAGLCPMHGSKILRPELLGQPLIMPDEAAMAAYTAKWDAIYARNRVRAEEARKNPKAVNPEDD